MRFFWAGYLDYLIREILPKVGQVVAIKHGKIEVPTHLHISPWTSLKIGFY
jgi:hypothetical protein